MRKIAANYIYTVSGQELKNGIVEIDETGKILNVIDTKGNLKEISNLEFYNGIIVPGFVNAHSHIELAHMKDVLTCRKKGLPSFIEEIIAKRNFPDDLKEQIKNAEQEMANGGIVAVGDISNTDDSFAMKKNSKLYFHTFIETFTVDNNSADEAFATAKVNREKLNSLQLPSTIVHHSSYTVPDKLSDMIVDYEKKIKKIISVHNQETIGEDELLLDNKGELKETLERIGFNFSDFTFDRKNAIKKILSNSKKNDNILLIHNTFTSEDDLKFAENYSDNIYWVFCPNSNIFIEDRLPNLPMFFDANVKTCFGTDSYASNDELSILSEMKTVAENFPQISFYKIIKSATLNGAKALNIDNVAGSIEVGKTPGINLITNFDFENKCLTDKSEVKCLTL